MYRTDRVLRRQLRVRYPVTEGRIVLRTELDWEHDLAPSSVTSDGTTYTFDLEARRPFLYFKPCLRVGDQLHWAVGPNPLVIMTAQATRDVFPFFHSPDTGSFTSLIELDSKVLGRRQRVRAYLPAGYHENTLRHYPALYMQDGKNLFFPEEAFAGHEWRVDESLALLNGMDAVEKVVAIGIHAADRMHDYTKPGYEAYGRSVVEEIKPEIDRRLRVKTDRLETAVMGSSLGGVVSFYMAWQWPEVFGHAACLSSTFSYRDDLMERVLAGPKRNSILYLDSGWPGDNYEATLAMAMALDSAGYVHGRDFLHLAFPFAEHDEHAWADRLHVPLQLFWGKLSSEARLHPGNDVPSAAAAARAAPRPRRRAAEATKRVPR